MGINTTTSALLYKHAFMATWLEWWIVVASQATFRSASTWMGDPGFLRGCSGWVVADLLQFHTPGNSKICFLSDI